MTAFTNYAEELVKTDLELFREFDTSNFVRNAKYSLSNKVTIPFQEIALKKYSELLKKTLDQANSLQFNQPLMADLLTRVANSEVINLNDIYVRDFGFSGVKEIKPQYLKTMTENVGIIIDKILKKEEDKKVIDTLISSEFAEKIKRQIVKTSYSYHSTAKDLFNSKVSGVKVSKDYIVDQMLPFVNNEKNILNLMNIEMNNLITALDDVSFAMNLYAKTLNRVLSNKDDEVVQKLYYFVYNAIHSVMEILSFVSFCAINKMNDFIERCIACSDLYDKVSDLLPTTTNESALLENAFDRNIVANDAESVAKAMMDGKTDVFQSLSDDIVGYHKSMVTNQLDSDVSGDDEHSAFDIKIENFDYEGDIYDEIGKIFIIITKSLEILAANSDDYLLVFDDLIEKAGLGVSLLDRFKNVLDSIPEIPHYTSAVNIAIDGVQNDIYYRMLREVRDYPANMDKLSNIIKDTKTVLLTVKSRFESEDIDDVFKNSEAIQELKTYMTTMNEEYDTLVQLVADRLIERLKDISSNLEKLAIIQSREHDLKANSEVNSDFVESVLESYIDLYEAETDEIMQNLLLEYHIEKEFQERGVRLVLEADEQATTQTSQPAQQPATTATPASTNNDDKKATTEVKDNKDAQNSVGDTKTVTANTNDPNAKGAGAKIIESIKNFFNKMMDQITTWITKDVDKAWLSETIEVGGSNMSRKDYLLARCNKGNGFNSVQVACPDFEAGMPYARLSKDFGTLVNKAGAIDLNTIKTEADARTKVYSLVGLTVKGADNNAIGTEIINFYKAGNTTEPENKTYANSEVKDVVNNAITYCEYYFGTFSNELKQNSDKLKTTLNPLATKVTTESVSLDVLEEMYMKEAEEAANTTNTATPATDNKEAGNPDKMKWIATAMEIYARAIAVSAKQRKVAYMSILKGLCPQPVANAQTTK